MSVFPPRRRRWIPRAAGAGVALLALAWAQRADRVPAPDVHAWPEPPTTGTCAPFDLDGDGHHDALREDPDTCGTGGCVYRVFLTRPDRPDRFVGSIDAHCPIELGPARRGALPDIVATWRLGCCEWTETRYRFSLGRYRFVDERTCTAGTDDLEPRCTP
jgi:hypothetical protein